MKPHFSPDQIIEIYEAAGRSLDRNILDAKAKELYPDILEPDGRSPIFVREGTGKAFLVNGERVKGTHTLASRMLVDVGILKDGTPIPY